MTWKKRMFMVCFNAIRKLMKKILFFAAAFAAILTSCNNETGEALSQESEPETNNNVKIYATIIQDEEPNTTSSRVMMGQSNGSRTPLRWQQGDAICIFNNLDYSITFGKYVTKSTVDNGDAKAEFEYVAGNPMDSHDNHLAFYPYERLEGTSSHDEFRYNPNQTYTANSFDRLAMPLMAFNRDRDETKFSFKAQAAVLRLKVSTNDNDVTVTSIDVASKNKALTGLVKVTKQNPANYEYYCGIPDTQTGKKVTLNCSTPVAINGTPKDFNIVLPAQTYPTCDLVMTIHTNKGDIIKESTRAIDFQAGKVYNVGLVINPSINNTALQKDGVAVPWVQLWDGGPKFAEYNVGATSVTDFGPRYSWGDSPNLNDPAKSVWGDNWRVPTKEEILALIANCDVTWVKNYNGVSDVNGNLFTGKGKYSYNKIFLPADGVGEYNYRGHTGIYWTSTPSKEGEFYVLAFYGDNDCKTNAGWYSNKYYTTRAVLVEP